MVARARSPRVARGLNNRAVADYTPGGVSRDYHGITAMIIIVANFDYE